MALTNALAFGADNSALGVPSNSEFNVLAVPSPITPLA